MAYIPPADSSALSCPNNIPPYRSTPTIDFNVSKPLLSLAFPLSSHAPYRAYIRHLMKHESPDRSFNTMLRQQARKSVGLYMHRQPHWIPRLKSCKICSWTTMQWTPLEPPNSRCGHEWPGCRLRTLSIRLIFSCIYHSFCVEYQTCLNWLIKSFRQKPHDEQFPIVMCAMYLSKGFNVNFPMRIVTA